MMYGPVVVGVDDLEHSRRAWEVAAHEALMRETPLWLVHAYHWTPPVAFGVSVGAEFEESARGVAEALLDEAVELVQAAHPGLAVRTAPMGGPIPQVLVEVCADASLVVVGDRGRGGFSGLMLGSAALRAVTRTHVPVMVVRGAEDGGTGPVVVGADVLDPVSGPELLEFAFAEAAMREVGLHVVHAWDDDTYLYLRVGGEYVTDHFKAVAADRERRLDALLAPWQEKHPGVRLSRQMFAGSPAQVLIESSRLAGVVVVGGRVRASGHDGLRVGALAHTVLHHAHCPVTVVPEH
jgi:nucleotide-binding universal stress UspA family protein